jgi:hypothetical protein
LQNRASRILQYGAVVVAIPGGLAWLLSLHDSQRAWDILETIQRPVLAIIFIMFLRNYFQLRSEVCWTAVEALHVTAGLL